MADNIVFQQKPAFNVSMQGDLSILPFRLALTGIRTAPPGSAEDVRYADFALHVDRKGPTRRSSRSASCSVYSPSRLRRLAVYVR